MEFNGVNVALSLLVAVDVMVEIDYAVVSL